MKTALDQNILAPIEIWEVSLDESTIKFHQPLVLTPTWLPDDPDEPSDTQYLEIEYPELAISAFGEDRRELMVCVRGDIRFAWRHYVQEDDMQLSRECQQIKQNYLAVAEVVDG